MRRPGTLGKESESAQAPPAGRAPGAARRPWLTSTDPNRHSRRRPPVPPRADRGQSIPAPASCRGPGTGHTLCSQDGTAVCLQLPSCPGDTTGEREGLPRSGASIPDAAPSWRGQSLSGETAVRGPVTRFHRVFTGKAAQVAPGTSAGWGGARRARPRSDPGLPGRSLVFLPPSPKPSSDPSSEIPSQGTCPERPILIALLAHPLRPSPTPRAPPLSGSP